MLWFLSVYDKNHIQVGKKQELLLSFENSKEQLSKLNVKSRHLEQKEISCLQKPRILN